MIRKANPADISAIEGILQDAKDGFAAAGIDQWQRGYPRIEDFANDIAGGVAYVLEKDGLAAAYTMLRIGQEDTYDHLYDGAWLSPEDTIYGVIHRIMVSARCKRQGLAGALLEEVSAIALAAGCPSLRVDTHPENRPMRGLLESLGYSYCGKVDLIHGPDAGHLRYCYEKIL